MNWIKVLPTNILWSANEKIWAQLNERHGQPELNSSRNVVAETYQK